MALFFKKYLEEKNLSSADIVDLAEYDFPLFHERLKHEPNPTEKVLEFAGRIKSADGVIIVTPEYNGGYPASIKNVVDLLYDEWHRKPLVISTVSDGQFGGTQVLVSLHFSLWKIRAWMVPAMFPVPDVDKTFQEDGTPVDKQATDKRAKRFIDELLWCIEAKRRMESDKMN